DVALLFVTAGSNLCCRADETAQDRLFPHDAGVVRNIGCGGYKIRQSSQIGASSDGVKFAPILKKFTQGNEIRRFAPIRKLDHGPENLAVRFSIEIFRAK